MADTVKTIGTGGDYADPILWAAAEGNVNDGSRAVGNILNDITMSGLFRPNQSFPNGGLLKGNINVTGNSGDGVSLGNSAGTRLCLAPSDNISFEDIEFLVGSNTYIIQNSGNTTLTRCLMPDGFIYYAANKTLTLNNCLIDKIDGLVSTAQGNIVFSNTTVTDRIIIRAETLLTIKNSNSLANDWLLGRGTYTNSDTLANNNYILQNAPASDFGVGSSDNTLNTDTTLEMVDFAGGDYRIKSTSTLATAGVGGTFIGAFLEVSSGVTVTAESGAFATSFQPVTLTYSSLTSYTITADSGGFTASGKAVDLLFNRNLSIDNGSYATSFQDATLVYATAGKYTLVVNNGSFNTSGTDLALLYNRALPVDDGAFNTAFNDASLSLGRRIQALSGGYAATGQDINFLYNRVIMAQSGDFITTGYNVSLLYSGQPSQTIGTVTVGFKQDIYTVNYKPNSITVSFKD